MRKEKPQLLQNLKVVLFLESFNSRHKTMKQWTEGKNTNISCSPNTALHSPKIKLDDLAASEMQAWNGKRCWNEIHWPVTSRRSERTYPPCLSCVGLSCTRLVTNEDFAGKPWLHLCCYRNCEVAPTTPTAIWDFHREYHLHRLFQGLHWRTRTTLPLIPSQNIRKNHIFHSSIAVSVLVLETPTQDNSLHILTH